jgi:antitoxin HigA-1
LTRVSIALHKKRFSKRMDCRIKSGNDAVFVEARVRDYDYAEEEPMPRPAIHPGEILADELNELEITPTELSRQISVPPNRISQIIQGKRAITGDTALRLGHWFQTSAQFWLNLQSAYDLRVATELAALPTKAARRRTGE